MYKTFDMELAGRTLRVDVGRVAKQANGAVLCIIAYTFTKSYTQNRSHNLPPMTSCIPEEDRHRKISCTDRETWIKKIIHAFYGDIRKNVPFSLPDIGDPVSPAVLPYCATICSFCSLEIMFVSSYILLIKTPDIK